ncbi:unnamed protein product [Caenorhabditis auriculariae]|uniref:ditrans,polycis-polyprenyl diphosphate synthase [(2E,6E)-farnesyldiphosphate specific] n=1 Tax=Caenorhabditis auriculariae TaxID=2777116 RepID=A0A8S1HAD7_9PELO|nr:unnamed protein product [Caenorhabditis auriculariae]
MLDIGWLCGAAVRAVYWLVMLACNFLGYSPMWAKNALKRRNMESFRLRTPSNLAILYTERVVEKEELRKLIEICSKSGVRHLSLYDHWGDVQKCVPNFVDFCRFNGIRLILGRTVEVSPDFSASGMTVQVLSSDSGKRALVDVCKSLCESNVEITTETISEKIALDHLLVDPDFLIQVGSVPSLCGYPPWNLRVTEFMQTQRLPTTPRAFENCIETFSRRDIRVGK